MIVKINNSKRQRLNYQNVKKIQVNKKNRVKN